MVLRWARRIGLEPLDVSFAGLRVATLVAGLLWWGFADDGIRRLQLPILVMFLVFSIGLYGLNAVRPGRLRVLYRVALVFDLALIFSVVRLTGGYASELHLAFILLIALHAFYFGVGTGVATAAASIVVYALAGEWPPPLPAFPLRAGFFALVGLCMGLLSAEERRRREETHDLQNQLIRSDRLATVGELAASLVHELRNPLAGISGALRVLGSQLEAGDERGSVLADVDAEIMRMNRTLTELLRHVRPAKPERVPVDVNELLKQDVRFLSWGNVEVLRQLDASVPVLLVDPNLLHQAVLNVLVNARQAMPAGGRLTLGTRVVTDLRNTSGASVEIEIGDTGIGISPEWRDRIFQPFFTTKAQGTGLGLAIAARIVEQHGGRITVESTPRVGTTFTITLPATLAADAHERSARAARPA